MSLALSALIGLLLQPSATPVQQVLVLVNREREARRLSPLRANAQLTAAAQNLAEDLAKTGRFSHTDSKGLDVSDRVDRVGYSWSAVGENIAKGQRTAAQAMSSWMKSRGHRENLLSRDFTEIGVATARDSSGRTIWVQVFARPN